MGSVQGEPPIDLDTSAVAVPHPGRYEAPRIEAVVSAEDLVREIQYAGFPPSVF